MSASYGGGGEDNFARDYIAAMRDKNILFVVAGECTHRVVFAGCKGPGQLAGLSLPLTDRRCPSPSPLPCLLPAAGNSAKNTDLAGSRFFPAGYGVQLDNVLAGALAPCTPACRASWPAGGPSAQQRAGSPCRSTSAHRFCRLPPSSPAAAVASTSASIDALSSFSNWGPTSVREGQPGPAAADALHARPLPLL